MRLKYENCGKIKSADINVEENRLNIKFGMNGIGKTTLGKCLYATINQNQEILDRYIPFGVDLLPQVSGSSSKSVLYFDREYVDNYLFRKDLLNNTFEIIVKTPDYEKSKKDIEDSFADLNEVINSEDLETLSREINNVVNNIKYNKEKTDFLGTSSFTKGLNLVNIEKAIDETILIYKKLITAPNNFNWSDWFSKGKDFIIENECPFCTKQLSKNFTDIHKKVISSFDKNTIKNSTSSNSVLFSVKNLSNKTDRDKIETDQNDGKLSKESFDYIKMLVSSLGIEKSKLDGLKNLDPFVLMNSTKEKLDTFLSSFKLNDELYSNISTTVHDKVKVINQKIDEYIQAVEDLNKKLGILRLNLTSSIKKLQKFVNDFLDISGIPYEIATEINGEDDCRTILKPKGLSYEINEVTKTLSYGEINAVSLVLFAVEAINKKVDLIILDDPVSSFDENIKYSIIYQLFSSHVPKNLRGRTVLFYTHDFVPVIDFVYNGLPVRDEAKVSYLYNYDGMVTEKYIIKKDILSAIDHERKLATNPSKNMMSRIVHLRNYYDLSSKNYSVEYSIISSIIHAKEKPDNHNGNLLSQEDLQKGYTNIKEIIEDFDYQGLLNQVRDKNKLKDLFETGGSIDKVFAARLLITQNPDKKTDKVLWKYISEFFHCQNQYALVLDPESFENVPVHILKSCSELFD